MKADSAEAKAKLNRAQRRDQRARQAAADKGEKPVHAERKTSRLSVAAQTNVKRQKSSANA
jgi:hypothetical protein